MWLLPSNQSPLPSPDPSSRQAPAFNSSHLACDNALRGSAAPRGVWPGRHSLSTVWTVPLARVHNCICGTVWGPALHPRHRPRAPENLQSLTAPEPAGAACAQTPQQEQAEPPRSPCFPSCVPTCTHVSHRTGSPASLLISKALPRPTRRRVPEGKPVAAGLPRGAAGRPQRSASRRRSPAPGAGPSAASCVRGQRRQGGPPGAGTAWPGRLGVPGGGRPPGTGVRL